MPELTDVERRRALELTMMAANTAATVDAQLHGNLVSHSAMAASAHIDVMNYLLQLDANLRAFVALQQGRK